MGLGVFPLYLPPRLHERHAKRVPFFRVSPTGTQMSPPSPRGRFGSLSHCRYQPKRAAPEVQNPGSSIPLNPLACLCSYDLSAEIFRAAKQCRRLVRPATFESVQRQEW